MIAFMSSENGINMTQTWYDNRELWTRRSSKNGKEGNESRIWHENGQLAQRQFYQDGKREGEVKLWHANGNPFIKTFYRAGKLEGERKMWNADGFLVGKLFYRNDDSIDGNFTRKKRLLILRFKKLYNRDVYRMDTFLISDLGKTASVIN